MPWLPSVGDVPAGAFLRKYQDGKAFADCYVTEVPGTITQRAFVEAFYTTSLFKVERRILQWFAARPSTDAEARQLAAGETGSFAAWRVEDRSAQQLLLSDFTGRTRSWLMTVPSGAGPHARTRLYFGSAVVPRTDRRSGRRQLGFAFEALLGFHRLYSRLLLKSARLRVLSMQAR
ncbi:MAG TPA: hypothetical protein VM073_11160 [Usitatibacter sp.]|nr:hypothetical protein [Usitatibacter sp.]